MQISVTSSYMDGHEVEFTELSLAFEYGITDQFEMVVAIPYLAVESKEESYSNGTGDMELGALYNLINTEALVFSIALEASLPTGDEEKELGEGSIEWEPSLLLVTQAGTAQLYFSIGGEFSDGESAATWSAAAAFAFMSATAVLELNGSSGGEEDTAYFTFGLVRKLPQNMQLQVGITTGLTNDAADWGAVVNWNVEF